MIQKRTVGIVGAGNVGIAAAYAMFLRQAAGELILIDKDSYRAEGEAMDLMHGQPYVGNISVRAGDYPDLGKTQVVVIAAGAAQRRGEMGTDLLNRNVDIFRKIVSHLDRYSPTAVIIDRKGYTNTAIGIVIARLVEAVIGDQKRVLTVSSRLAGEYGQTDVVLSLPCVVGQNGVESKILPRLNDVELKGLEESAEFLRHNLDDISDSL